MKIDEDLIEFLYFCNELGYSPTEDGKAYAVDGMRINYSPGEMSLHIALLAFARDALEQRDTFFATMKMSLHASEILRYIQENLARLRIKREMLENETIALKMIATPGLQRDDWIQQVLVEKIGGKKCLAKSKKKYA